MKPRDSYVLITPAKNEEASIGLTIESVVNQTQHPAEWVVVNDGSSDRTDEVVQTAAAVHPWIRLLTLPPRAQRSFAAVVHATEAGVRALTTDSYEYIGLLDADVRFQPDYFERVIEHFQSSPRLGMAGGVVIDLGQPKDRLPRNRQDVPGAVQFFRRNCFEALGGLIAIQGGGWDGLACAQVRMLGFETRLLTDLIVDHLKPRNISEGGLLRRKWQMGVRDYVVGYHPLFEVFKCLSRFSESPLLLGGLVWWVGYCCAAIQRRERRIPQDLLAFLRAEQKKRLLEFLPGTVAAFLPGGIRMSTIILNFHGVGTIPRILSHGERDCWLEQDAFEAVLDLAQGQAHVQLTFDDGNASDAELVLPGLLRRGLSATFFVCSSRLDQPTFLSRAQVGELRAQGMAIGSHGVAHRPWRKLSPHQLADELEGSRQVLEEVCGRAVDTAACPFGDYDRAVLKGLRRAGYRLVYTSDGGSCNQGDWLQPRTTVSRSMPLADVERLVQQGVGSWKQSLIHGRSLIKRIR